MCPSSFFLRFVKGSIIKIGITELDRPILFFFLWTYID